MELLRLGLKSVCSQKTTPNLTTFEIYDLLTKYNLSQYEINYSLYPAIIKTKNSGTTPAYTNNLYSATGLVSPMLTDNILNTLPDNCLIRFKFGFLTAGAGNVTIIINNQINGIDHNNTTQSQTQVITSNLNNILADLILTKNELLEHTNLIYTISGGSFIFYTTMYIYDLNK